MNRNQLKYFVAAAESRSFTKAAEQFYISQTAITQQIRLLEEALGCPLFDRSTRPVSLTPAGTIFLREAKGILERMSRAQERVHDASTGLSGTLRVGYVRGYERSDLSAHIRQFHQQNSNVLITFYRCSTDALAAGLLHHEYDIIFTWDSTNLKTQEGVACRTVEKPNILFRSADTESILMMVSAEEGISILPAYCVEKLYNADNLVFVPLIGEGEVEEIIAAWQTTNPNPALARFLAMTPPQWE